MTPIDCINTVSAPTWPVLVAVTSGHEHQWAPTNLTIYMGRPFNTSGVTMSASRMRRYACLICGAVEDRPEAP